MTTISIYNNYLKHTQIKREKLENLIKKKGFNTGRNGEFIFVLGGDGTFLRAIQKNFYKKPKPKFIGINTGNLGFLSEFKFDDVEEVLEKIKREKFKVQSIPLYKVIVKYNTNHRRTFHFINDVVFERKGTRIIHTGIQINGEKLSDFSGDGIIVSTPLGSTGYSMSTSGAISYDCQNILQITPSNPIISKAYQSLSHPLLVKDNNEIKIFPHGEKRREFRVVIDGEEVKGRRINEIIIKESNFNVDLLRSESFDPFKNFKNKILDVY